jgi:hypothetical protein
MVRALILGNTLAFLLVCAPAFGDDPAAALEQLRNGYALKKAGRCADALPHFVESERLDPQPKTLLNMADCEDQLSDLVHAQQHAALARDLARQSGNEELLSIAEKQLAELDKRLPRLTLRVASDAPPNVVVSRDGTALGSVSLGVPLPINPGNHVVTVSAPGHADARYEIRLAEGAQQTLDVRAGAAQPTPSPPSPEQAPVTPRASSGSLQKTFAWVSLGIGVVGVGVGSVFGVLAIKKNHDSNAGGHCDSTGCDATGKSLRNEALGDATISTVAFAVGLVAIAGGIVLWATAPSPSVARAGGVRRLELIPSVAAGRASLVVTGAW